MCSRTSCGRGTPLGSSQSVVQKWPEHTGCYPCCHPVAVPHTACCVGIAEVTAAAGDIPVAHAEVLIE